MKPVRIVAKNPDIDITIPMGDGPAYPTGGLGGWTTVALQDDVEGVDWEGQDPLTQDVPLLLNGLERDESVEREWNTVKKLGRDPNGDEHRPPVFRVYGPVEYPGKAWVLPSSGIEVVNAAEEMIRRNGDGELLRVEFVLHLLEYTPPEVIKARRRRRGVIGLSQNVAVGGTYTTGKDDTLAKIAARLLNDPGRWKEIANKNGLHDPNRTLPARKVLKL
jgi:LysM domain